jgi:hypothetical protein
VSETRPDQQLDGALEFEALKNFAWQNGFFAQIHRNFTPRPGQERNCWYLQKSNKHNPGVHQDTILKFSTAEEIHNWIVAYLAAEKSESPQ